MPKSKINDGFVYVTNYSYKFRKLIQFIAEKAEKTLPSKELNEIGIFLYGSPSRQEMIDESDADIMIIRKKDSKNYKKFRTKFISLLEKENLVKIDIPDWGTFDDCETYIKYSITEGNQVVEAKFIYGDLFVNKYIEDLKDKYCNLERFEKVLCFQKLYFDQYYKQRTKPGIKNVKYGHGGTRDFMFITWFINLLDSLDKRKINMEDNFPLVYKSLSSLYERRFIKMKEYRKYLESVNVVLILRNEILIQNRGTSEEGLTYLDSKTINTLFKRKIFREKSICDTNVLKKYLNYNIDKVMEIKQKIWDFFIDYLYNLKGKEWGNLFKKFIEGKFSNKSLLKIGDDELLQIAVIWNINKKNNPYLFKNLFNKYSKSQSWVVLASLCCHAQCSAEILDFITSNRGFKKGYEYLLKIISRNKNVTKETLKKIIDNPKLECRFKLPAKIAYEEGVEKANELR